MHVQGRRWGGFILDKWNPKKNMAYKGSIYDAEPTFESYGVAHGSPGCIASRLFRILFVLGSQLSLNWWYLAKYVIIIGPVNL